MKENPLTICKRFVTVKPYEKFACVDDITLAYLRVLLSSAYNYPILTDDT